MTNRPLLDYIRQQLAGGVSKEDIAKALLSNNWSVQDMNEAFASIEKVPPPPAPPAPIPVAPAPALAQPSSIPEQTVSRPSSVTVFEMLMYISIIASVVTAFLKYGQYITSQYQSASAYLLVYALLIPLALVIGKLALVFLAAHRTASWARIVLLVLFLTNVMGFISIVRMFFSDPVSGLAILSPILLEALALGFVFSPSANRWFEPAGAMANNSRGAGVENTTWSKGIPRINTGFMMVSLLLVFGLDLVILINEPDLFPFYAAMLAVLGIFSVFLYRENRVLNKRFASSSSTLDKWLVTLVVIRDIVFVLNFIPFIQILGGAALVFGGIPYLAVYFILLSKRAKML